MYVYRTYKYKSNNNAKQFYNGWMFLFASSQFLLFFTINYVTQSSSNQIVSIHMVPMDAMVLVIQIYLTDVNT